MEVSGDDTVIQWPGKRGRPPAEREPVKPEAAEDQTSMQVAAGQLRAFVERIERLHEERDSIGDDLKDVYAELKGTGFDAKAVKAIVRLRKMDQAERQEAEAILDLYKAALGMA